MVYEVRRANLSWTAGTFIKLLLEIGLMALITIVSLIVITVFHGTNDALSGLAVITLLPIVLHAFYNDLHELRAE
jgi:hypothetical protein